MTIFSMNQIKFDKNYLDELTSEPNSGVFKQRCKYHVALHPAQFNDFGQSIKDELNRKIARFDELFKGIMLGYENITLQSELGVIGPDNCYIHIDIEASFFVFRPEIGMILKGKVTRTTKDHVGCLVYNTFNISIPKPESDDEDSTWLGKKVTVNSEVEFKIIYVDLNARLPHIRGELRAIIAEGEDTGNDVALISKNKHKKKSNVDVSDKWSNLEQKKNKKIRFDSVDEKDSPDNVIESPKKSKKKHKEKHRAEQALDEPSEEAETTKKTKKKAKKDKRKRDKSEDLDVSLESLDIKALFADSTVDFTKNSFQNQTLADSSDKKVKKKRSHSVSDDAYLGKIKLETDSDLEKIISGTYSK